MAFFPLQIGDHVFIGDNSIVNAAVVNSYVYIGKNVTIVSNIEFIDVLIDLSTLKNIYGTRVITQIFLISFTKGPSMCVKRLLLH